MEFTVPDPNDAESTITVDIDLDEHGLIVKAVHDNQMAAARKASEAKVAQAVAQAADPKSYSDNEEFKEAALAAWGVNPNGDPDVAANIRKAEVQPLKEEIASLKQRNQSLLNRDRDAQILSALGGHVRPEWMEGASPAILPLLTSGLKYNEQEGQWCVEDGNGGYKTSSVEGRTYVNIEDHCQEFLGSDAAALYKIDRRQGGPSDINPTVGQNGSVTISQADSRNNKLYQQAQAEADKLGVEVEII